MSTGAGIEFQDKLLVFIIYKQIVKLSLCVGLGGVD